MVGTKFCISALFQTAENLRIRGLADVDTGDDDAASEQQHTASSYTPSKFASSSRRSPSKIGRTTPNNNVASEKASSSSKVDRFAQPVFLKMDLYVFREDGIL